jgi:hypothetical protein
MSLGPFLLKSHKISLEIFYKWKLISSLVNQPSNAAPSTCKVLLGMFWYPTCIGSDKVSDQGLRYPNGLCALPLWDNHFRGTRVIWVTPKLLITIMNIVELRILTIGTIFTKMSLLTTSVANFVLDVAIVLYTCHWAILLSKFFLSLPEGTFGRLVQALILCPFSWQPKHLLWARLLCLFDWFELSYCLNEHMDA